MKKFISALLVTAMLMALVPSSSFLVFANGSDGLTYELSDNGGYYIIIGYTGSEKEVVIPTEYNGRPVREISDYAFIDNTLIESVIISDSVCEVGVFAFVNCANLRKVQFSPSVEKVGENAFSGCTNLESVYISDVSAWCDMEFGNDAACPFYFADSLYVNGTLVKSITVPDGTKKIKNYAFCNYSALESITLADTVEYIGVHVFDGCSSLKYKVFDNAKYLSSENNSYYALVSAVDTSITQCEINDSTRVMAGYCFSGCKKLTSIVIPDSVIYVGAYSFNDCFKLKTADLPDTITRIETGLFGGCLELSDLEIPDTVTSIGGVAFDACVSLKTLVIPDLVTVIETAAFQECHGLKNIIIPDSVIEIQPFAFNYCKKLLHIYSFAEEKPAGWADNWIGYNCPATVHWGYTEEVEIQVGDLNFDGIFTAVDYLILRRIIIGSYVPSEEWVYDLCDFNNDGFCSVVDYIMLKRAILKKK